MNLFPVYSLYDVEPVKGCGNRIYDSQGTEYLDFYGGHAVISIGHSNPHYVEMICNQVSKLGFYSNFVQNPLQKKLAEKLGKLSGYEDYSLFLANSGAEANENAVKVASFQTGKSRVLAFKGAFHGRTSGAVELTDIPKYRAPFNLSDNVTFVPLNDLEAVNKELASGEYCAVIIEGIQGVAGIHMPSDDFLRELRQTTTSHGVCLILDEVQSGYGRSGR
ncbi:MAG: aspartate aminotransferase family protein, partial [Muribaculaceae bacterium]|nr:aspartate aminotransferase family protein [Muribaculaceae bacterium]